MSESIVVLRRVRVARDLAVALTGAAAGTHQGITGNWTGLALAVLAAAACVTLWRVKPSPTDRITPPLLVLLAVLLVWGFRENLLWLSTAGAVTLVAAIDLDRLEKRFPLASSLASQRAVWVTHLFHLLAIAALSVFFSLATIAITLRLQLLAVMLLTLFVVISFVRILRSMQQGD